MSASQSTTVPVIPTGLNHPVLNVRNLEDSHVFWTAVVSFEQVGELKKTAERPKALIENPAPPTEWAMNGMPMAISHLAMSLPNREAWLRQVKRAQSKV